MSRARLIEVAAVFLAFAAAVPAFGWEEQDQDPAAVGAVEPGEEQPVAGEAETESLTVIVAEVVGVAQVRPAPDAQWQRAEVGMELGEGAEVRTGPRSRVVCTIPPDQIITIERLGVVSILEAARHGNTVTTDVLMKYGRTNYEIEAAGREHDAKIRTPSATLSVRGTAYTAYDQPPFAPSVQVYRGAVDYRYNKRLLSVRGGSRAVGSQGSSQTAMNETVVDPGEARARTGGETSVIANETSRGAVVNYDPNFEINVSRGGSSRFRNGLVEPAALPGRLNFILSWATDADLNLAVIHQAGDPLSLLGFFEPDEFLYPGFRQNITPSGGRIMVNNRGGASGGEEIAFWENTAPEGIYGLQALNASDEPVVARFNAYLDGRLITLFSSKLDENGDSVLDEEGFPILEFATTIVRTVPANGDEVATVLVPQLFEPVDDLAATEAARRLRVNGAASPSARTVDSARRHQHKLNARTIRQSVRQARKAERLLAKEVKLARDSRPVNYTGRRGGKR